MPPALVMSGLWLSVYTLHAARETAVAKMFGVWTSTILTWIRRYAADHAEKPAPSGKAIVLETGSVDAVMQQP
jgi:transposase